MVRLARKGRAAHPAGTGAALAKLSHTPDRPEETRTFPKCNTRVYINTDEISMRNIRRLRELPKNATHVKDLRTGDGRLRNYTLDEMIAAEAITIGTCSRLSIPTLHLVEIAPIQKSTGLLLGRNFLVAMCEPRRGML